MSFYPQPPSTPSGNELILVREGKAADVGGVNAEGGVITSEDDVGGRER